LAIVSNYVNTLISLPERGRRNKGVSIHGKVGIKKKKKIWIAASLLPHTFHSSIRVLFYLFYHPSIPALRGRGSVDPALSSQIAVHHQPFNLSPSYLYNMSPLRMAAKAVVVMYTHAPNACETQKYKSLSNPFQGLAGVMSFLYPYTYIHTHNLRHHRQPQFFTPSQSACQTA
jgi:hypothetical protein